MGRSQRRKGHDFERWTVRQLRAVGFAARRGLQSQDGSAAADVEGTPLRFECKIGKSVSVRAALRQLERDGEAADDPRPRVVVARDHGDPDPFVVLPWLDFLRLLLQLEPGASVRGRFDTRARIRALLDGAEGTEPE